MRLTIVIIFITIICVNLTTNDSISTEEPCLIVKIYNERKDLLESAMQEMLELESVKNIKEELTEIGQDTTQLADEIKKKDDTIDTKFLRVLELSKEQRVIFNNLINDIDEMEEICSQSNDSQQKPYLKMELDSKYECLDSLRQEIKRRRSQK